jgi:hypothetical protein
MPSVLKGAEGYLILPEYEALNRNCYYNRSLYFL